MVDITMVSPEDGFFKKLFAFNQMATRTIESNKIAGFKAVVVRITVILDSFSLFNILMNQKRMMNASIYGLIEIINIQKRLNENGVAYTFPVAEPQVQPQVQHEVQQEYNEEQLKHILTKIDHTKHPKN